VLGGSAGARWANHCFDSAKVLHFDQSNGGRFMQSTVTVKGQATLPKAVRDHLKLKPGDKVKFFIHPDGRVMLLPMVPISQLRGILKKPRSKPVTIEEMDDAIAEGVTERFLRSSRR
jgi:AbrB family looped-hinge helix DNA binding protein